MSFQSNTESFGVRCKVEGYTQLSEDTIRGIPIPILEDSGEYGVVQLRFSCIRRQSGRYTSKVCIIKDRLSGPNTRCYYSHYYRQQE